MPPDLDIYVSSRRRDRETIERFAARWIDRAASEDRGDEELMMLPLEGDRQTSDAWDRWDWEPAKTLTHIIDRGLDLPHRAFTTASRSRDPRVALIHLTFTADGMVVFGVSILDEDGSAEKLDLGKAVLLEIAGEVGGDAGYVTYEEPPPLTASVMPPPDARFVAYRWSA